MAAQARNPIPAARPARRADAGTLRKAVFVCSFGGYSTRKCRQIVVRTAARLAWWLLVAAAAVAAWPVTLVAAAGYTAAWLRGWPPSRLYLAAAWSLPMTVAWLAALEVGTPGFLAARTPGRTWSIGWDHLDVAGLARVFASLAPLAVPAGLALAGLIWAWRDYASTTGPGGITAAGLVPEPRHEPAPQPESAPSLADVAGPGAAS